MNSGLVYLSYPPLLEGIFVSGKANQQLFAGRETLKYWDVSHKRLPWHLDRRLFNSQQR